MCISADFQTYTKEEKHTILGVPNDVYNTSPLPSFSLPNTAAVGLVATAGMAAAVADSEDGTEPED